MASDCNTKLSGQFARKCGLKPKQGVSKKWYINWDDIDIASTQKTFRGTKVTALVLKAGAKIYPAEGNNKSKKVKHALAVGDYGKGYIHTDEFVLLYRGDNESERIQELVDGGRVVTLNKMIDTGVSGETTYKIGGLESGMEIINDDFDSTANSGTTTMIVATNEGEEEATGLKTFLMPLVAPQLTDLEETELWISTNEFVPV